MLRLRLVHLTLLSIIIVSFFLVLPTPFFGQDWTIQGKQQGTLKVVNLWLPSDSVWQNYSESLVMLDKDNNYVPCLAEDYRWIGNHCIEFRLRRGVTFHNGEEFDAKAVRVNWEQYKEMKAPKPVKFLNFPDETLFEMLDKYTVRFTLPEPDGLALIKFWGSHRLHRPSSKNTKLLKTIGDISPKPVHGGPVLLDWLKEVASLVGRLKK